MHIFAQAKHVTMTSARAAAACAGIATSTAIICASCGFASNVIHGNVLTPEPTMNDYINVLNVDRAKCSMPFVVIEGRVVKSSSQPEVISLSTKKILGPSSAMPEKDGEINSKTSKFKLVTTAISKGTTGSFLVLAGLPGDKQVVVARVKDSVPSCSSK